MELFDIKLHELELKYLADKVSLDDFHRFAKKQKPKRFLKVASYDTYYAPIKKFKKLSKKAVKFVRYRQGSNPELTIKVKMNRYNNNSRVEVDLPISNKKATKYLVANFVKWLGFEENFEIYKECYIYFYNTIDIVYYIVKDRKGGKELARFMEIERRKDVKCDDPNEAWRGIEDMEKKFAVFGISAQNRLKKSMWETFKKD